ncbi:hypothetical protein RUM43_009187 [Polyplax serrata]|uniref:CUB domain-containing protein n=1 Tax=Polyplax serrata TaxID=468196 RepID=A0AAN8NP27_POLSC
MRSRQRDLRQFQLSHQDFEFGGNDTLLTVPGNLSLSDETIAKSCNANINVTGEGLARSPGYPSYYIGEIACKWSLRAPHSQKVRVRLLDVSLRGIAPYDADCVDWIDITENGLNLVKTCGDVLEDVVVHSQGSALNVSFIANSKTIYPKRGFLFHYKAVGCSTLRKPEDAYLIERNNSFVHYRCCSGFVFRDSLARDKILQCYNENTWDGELSECVTLKLL